MSQNNSLFERSESVITKRNYVLQIICIFMLAIVLTACGGGGSGGSDSGGSSTSSNNTGTGGGGSNGGGANDSGDQEPIDPGNNGGNNGGGNGANELASFTTHLHPVITSSNNLCMGCHANNPNQGAPIQFAEADVNASYAIAKGQALYNLAVTDQSRFHVRPASLHGCIPADCPRVAAEFLAAINAMAAEVNAAGGGNNNANIVASATTNFSQLVEGNVPRADANQITLFNFSEGAGNTTVGTSNVGADMTLTLEGMEWVAEGGIKNVDGKAQASLADSQKLFNLLSGGNQFSIEAWVMPEALNQTGPARIVSYSIDTGRRNFTLGQTNTQYVSRIQTLQTGPNGNNPELSTNDDVLTTELTHVVMTYDNMAGGRKLYVNGQLAAEENIAADMLNWQDDNLFILGNEATNNRLWRGTFKMVAIHNTALNGAQVGQNFAAGAGAITALRFDVANVLGVPGYIEMQAYEADPYAYVFARPKLVTDASGVQVKNMRIAVNGNVPVAMQVFRRINMTVDSGQEISPLGALIPSELGMAADQISLQFEILGNQTGSTESIAPPAVPVPPADVPEPDVGVRTFSQVHDTFAAITGISQRDRDVRDRYNDIRDQLPPSADALGFGGSQQIAIQRLATTYCGEITNNNGRCRNFFDDNNCAIAAGEKEAIAGTVIDKTAGVNLVNQPDRAASIAALVGVMDANNCANGCDGNAGRQVLQAVCTAGLASSAVTIN